MAGMLNEAMIAEYFRNKSVLITGATGFLGKILVEKILRVQPDVKMIYLLVRAPDAVAARQRVETEVVRRELFCLLRQRHGSGFDTFVTERVVVLAGDVTCESFGIEAKKLRELRLTDELNIIVNSAATTNFYERYDKALDVNVMGVKHMCDFAARCPNLEVLLHVSTAYVAGEKHGMVPERLFMDGETLRDGIHLDIDAELRLARDLRNQMEADNDIDMLPKFKRKAMKDLGLTRARHFGWPNTYVFTKSMGEMMLGQMTCGGDVSVLIVRPSMITSVQSDPLPGWLEGTRTIDMILIGYAKQSLSCFLADLDLTMDVMPADMVVNAMMAAMVSHASSSRWLDSNNKPLQHPLLVRPSKLLVYHVTSSMRHPASYAVLYRTGIRYFEDHPRMGPDGRAVRTQKVRFLGSIAKFHLFMVLKYRIPLELLRLISLLCFGHFGLAALYQDLARNYRLVMQLVDLYGPFSLFKGCFDDFNLNKLRLAIAQDPIVTNRLFNFDPKTVDWDDYFYRIHIPGVMKYVLK
ncbi:probable fatty acyl-CoA reductase 5 isoform X1 [Hordeum vulgare subsp. vulgare]|uniref:Fatty acyl-CoA reductase n=1 Tax=Hordeum vulgare subsp. vulgare TaxID=112509 RepID=A0A8I6Y8S4_HORVV|nr:probable fatty acyl-CoA reductase 5 isoform X1 [Hordeum vulgare subsp. vulgare]